MNKIELEHDTTVSVVWYESLDARSFKQFSQPKWSELMNRLSIPQYNSNKYAQGLAVYGDFADSDDVKKLRKDDNVIYRDVIALDYDDITNVKEIYEAIKERLSGVSYFWHTTFSHTKDNHRIRLYVPVSERLKPFYYRSYSRVLAERIGFKVDEGSYQPSRAMALPVVQSKSHSFLYRYNDAPILDCPTLERWLNECVAKEPQTADVSKHKISKRRDDDFWKSIAFGVSTGNRNQMLTSLIGVLLNRRVPDPLVYAYCYMWNENCKPPLSSREFNATFESIYKREHR
ncbi:mobile element-associated protein [Staphylococcus schleiferi subsp. coagulans]|uniref:primase alpha helix C-terminal domain-containing protein n=1 Tax=Staphylococcus coagulans TaxID=74706 RepID=UPI0015FE3E40|nr:primase alpha helix C-terminal domain-containing protein [Staphylococcus coagulans]MBA8759856.1 mobile element-associated protein [Staphylococcus coagulans]MBA8768705.1 mobile element-associated protein [Staphylococcus coagulans]